MERPNILWLMTDEQRKDSLGLYGSRWAQTPNLDRLAAGGGGL
jgi:arylsulfatase A-like enzyme